MSLNIKTLILHDMSNHIYSYSEEIPLHIFYDSICSCFVKKEIKDLVSTNNHPKQLFLIFFSTIHFGESGLRICCWESKCLACPSIHIASPVITWLLVKKNSSIQRKKNSTLCNKLVQLTISQNILRTGKIFLSSLLPLDMIVT